MSAIHPQGTPVVPEPQDEQLPVGKIAIIAVISLALFAVGVAWATLILDTTKREVVGERGRAEPTYVGKPEIGMVDQVVFNAEMRAEQLRADKQQRLEGAGWASRRDNLVYIPVQDAMRAIVAGQRPGPVAPPSPEPLKNAPSGGPVMNPPQKTAPAPTPAGSGNDGSGTPDQQTPGAVQP